jgi:hypothetical protein
LSRRRQERETGAAGPEYQTIRSLTGDRCLDPTGPFNSEHSAALNSNIDSRRGPAGGGTVASTLTEGGRDLVVDSRGVQLAVRDFGGSGRAIIFLHGLGRSLIDWQLIAPPLGIERDLADLAVRRDNIRFVNLAASHALVFEQPHAIAAEIQAFLQ